VQHYGCALIWRSRANNNNLLVARRRPNPTFRLFGRFFFWSFLLNKTIQITVVGKGDTAGVNRSFRSSFDYIDKEAKKTADNLKKVFSGLTAGVAPQNRAPSGGGGGGRSPSLSGDPAMKAALADAKRLDAERLRSNRATNAEIERSEKALTRIKIGESKAANNAAIAELKKLERETQNSAGKSSSIFSQAFGGAALGTLVGGLATGVVSALASIPGRIAGIGESVFGLAKSFSETGTTIFTASQKIGMSAEALSVIKGAADISRSSIEDFTTGFARFEKNLSGGGGKVSGVFKQMGIDIKAGVKDPEAAFAQFLTKFNEIPAGANRAGVAIALFGKSGANLIPTFLKLGGSFEEAKQKAIEAGLVFDQDGVEKAKKFSDAYIQLQKVVKGFGLTIGKEFAPVITGAMEDISSFLIANRGAWTEWGRSAGALMEIVIGHIKETTGTLSDHKDQSKDTFAEVGHNIASTLISWNGYANGVTGILTDIQVAASMMGTVVKDSFTVAGKAIQYVMIEYMVKPLDTLGGKLNEVIDYLKSVPDIAKSALGIGFVDALPNFKKSDTDYSRDYGAELSAANAKLQADTNIFNTYDKLANLHLAKTNRFADLRALDTIEQRKRDEAAANKLKNKNRNSGLGRGTDEGGEDYGLGKGGGAKGKSAGRSKNPFEEIKDIIRSQDFIPGSAFRKGGPNGATNHAGSGAVDTSVKANPGKSVEDWTRLIVTGIEKGKQIIDERLVGFFPGIKSSGPNVHLGNSKNKSFFLPQKYYSVPVEYLKQLDEKRRGKTAGYTGDDIANFNQKQSDALTKAEQEKLTRKAIGFYKIVGLIPTGEMLDRFQSLAAEEAKKAGVVQPSKESIAATFEANRVAKLDARGIITGGVSAISSDISPQQNEDERYVANLRESLGLSEDINGVVVRRQNLVMRERNMMGEVTALLEDQSFARSEATLQAQIDYQLLLRRNSAEEVDLKFLQSKNDQLRELGDTEQAIDLLRRQNANEAFTNQRRMLASKREQLSLEQNITDLRDQIANGGANDALEIQAAQLRDIVDLRRREVDAVIATNRAQSDLANSMKISNTEIRAGIYQHLAEAKNINEAIADGFNKTFDSVSNKLLAPLDKLNEKTKGYLSFLIEPAKAIGQNALNGVFSRITDSIFPGLGDSLKSTGNPALDAANKSATHLESIDNKLGAVSAFGGGSTSIGGGTGIPGIGGRFFGGSSFGNSANPFAGNIGGGGGASGGYGSILGGLFGGGNSSASSSSGGGIASILNQFGLGKGFSSSGGGNLHETGQFKAAGGGSILGNLKNLFSTKEGGLFASKANLLNGGKKSALAGKMAGAGALMAMFGGLLPGRAGSTVSTAGTGMQLGAMLGPWGALAGGIIGGIVGLFTGGTKKKDTKAWQGSVGDAFTQLTTIKAQLDRRPPSINWDTGISNSTQIQSQYYEAMSQLKDKKTRNKAIADGRARIDPLVKQIAESAAQAHAWDINRGQVAKDFVGEFAGGVYMDKAFRSQHNDFKRRNGQMPGQYTGRDYIKALIGDGEIVANERQLNRMRRAAGFDVVAHAGLPNYAPKAETPRFASGVSFAAPIVVSNSGNNPNGNNNTPEIKIGDIVINLNGERITNAEIESIAINGVKRYVNRGGRRGA